MKYWSNQEAVRESVTGNTHHRGHKKDSPSEHAGIGHERWSAYMTRDDEIQASGRNPRSVLDVPTAPYKHAHYATYPPNLIAPLIRATCPRWACPVCGQGWSPVVETRNVIHKREPAHQPGNSPTKVDSTGWEPTTGQVKSYRPTCEHPHTREEAVPGIVLDPFVGSGTTGAVARELQLRWIGLDISFEYLDMQAKIRTKTGSPSNELEGLPLFERGNNNVG